MLYDHSQGAKIWGNSILKSVKQKQPVYSFVKSLKPTNIRTLPSKTEVFVAGIDGLWPPGTEMDFVNQPSVSREKALQHASRAKMTRFSHVNLHHFVDMMKHIVDSLQKRVKVDTGCVLLAIRNEGWRRRIASKVRKGIITIANQTKIARFIKLRA